MAWSWIDLDETFARSLHLHNEAKLTDGVMFKRRWLLVTHVLLRSLSFYSDMPTSDLCAVEALLQTANIPLDQVHISPVTAKSAFCNALYRVKQRDNYGHETSLVAKVFSPLAAARMHFWDDDSQQSSLLFRMDKLAAQQGVGPKIYAMIQNLESPALLMQDCPGRILTEQDLQENAHIVRLVASNLAALHGLSSSSSSSQVTTQPNMLWQSCNVLMQQYANPSWRATENMKHIGRDSWTYNRLADCIQRHRASLEDHENHLLVTASGHGDLKPGNLLLNDDSSTALFLDLELAGTNYVAFDLAKLWRSSTPSTPKAREMQRIFLETYAATCDNETINAALLQQQVDELMPLTWLEAAAFFVALSCSSSKSESKRWDALALDRLQSYQDSLSTCP